VSGLLTGLVNLFAKSTGFEGAAKLAEKMQAGEVNLQKALGTHSVQSPVIMAHVDDSAIVSPMPANTAAAVRSNERLV
jgi:ribosomal protein S12 methylthiotransferase accessory factor YcaO